jgi:endoglycosylceramidase
MYQRVAEAIREVDPRHVLFLEHSYFSNLGVPCAIRPVVTKQGTPDPQVAYAPHAYDLLTDTKGMAGVNNERIRVIVSRIHEAGQKTGMPIVLDEWGAFPGADPALVAPARQMVGLLEEFHMGNTYWTYSGDIGQQPYFREALLRAYPVCIAGELKSYRLDRDKNQFEVTWQESPCDGMPTVVFLPDVARVKKQEILLEPKAAKVTLRRMPDGPSGYLLIYPDAGNPSRKLSVTLTME